MKMISENRMKIDLIGQSAIVTGFSIIALSGLLWPWGLLALGLLALWQAGSAFQLVVGYHYQGRQPYLYLFGLLALGTALSPWLGWAWLGIGAAATALAYFWNTIRDTCVVMRRPRSFWDI